MIKELRNFARYVKHGGATKCTIKIHRSQRFCGKKVIVTGGSSGIGFATAKGFADEGGEVIILGRNRDKLVDASRQINNCSFLLCNMQNVDEIQKVAKEIINKYGDIDIIVNNAGVYSIVDFLRMDEYEFDSVLDTNLKGPYFMSQIWIKLWYENNVCDKEHCIINVISNRGHIKDTSPYGISKWGMRCFTEGLAAYAAPYNIRVNGVSPGITASNINGIDVTEDAYYSLSLDKRVATPDEIASSILFLASDDAHHIRGEILMVDGGEIL